MVNIWKIVPTKPTAMPRTLPAIRVPKPVMALMSFCDCASADEVAI